MNNISFMSKVLIYMAVNSNEVIIYLDSKQVSGDYWDYTSTIDDCFDVEDCFEWGKNEKPKVVGVYKIVVEWEFTFVGGLSQYVTSIEPVVTINVRESELDISS